MQSRCITSLFINLLDKSPKSLWKIERCQFHATPTAYRKKNKKGKGDDGPKIIKPICEKLPKPILEPSCKNAIVIGGSEGFGFAAADHLLCKGARVVVVADDDPIEGKIAVKKLCDSYGKNRALFVHYDVKSDCHVQAGLANALCKLKVVHILFNNLDKERPPLKCPTSTSKQNATTKTIQIGLELLGKDQAGSNGIIINCASIFGFMGWPEDPFPVYCNKEPAIEVTRDFAKNYKGEEKDVRVVALCPTTKCFSNIGLPDFPEPIPNKIMNEMPICIPHSKYHIGTALSYILAWAKNGSAWLVEPAISVHQIPRLIHFPEKEGGQVDPKVYQAQQPCPVKIEPPCVEPKVCVPSQKQMCAKKKWKDDEKK
ncbi:alcohol dehydrogenase 2 [Bombus vancouverensis nearcticus]|uniref:alcohol dehydrogenase 2 n=1 Tax=Bombus vancouverensis nearcticus TaxID=2705178 RepID=UPI00402B3AF7